MEYVEVLDDEQDGRFDRTITNTKAFQAPARPVRGVEVADSEPSPEFADMTITDTKAFQTPPAPARPGTVAYVADEPDDGMPIPSGEESSGLDWNSIPAW